MGAITESNIDIDFAGAATAPPPELDLRPEHLEFGRITAPLWFRAWYRNGAWERGRVEPWHTIDLHPAAIVLHYAQEIFEGLKAYKMPDGSAALFRPEMNARRMNRSAARMAMPAIPEQLSHRISLKVSAAPPEMQEMSEAGGAVKRRGIERPSFPA